MDLSLSSIFGFIFLTLAAVSIIANRKKIAAFAKASRLEMKKVVWPTPERALTQAKVVLVSLVIFSAFFGAIDIFLAKALGAIF